LKNIIITGASSGIGYECAILLAKEGFQVYAGARSLDKLKELEEYDIKIHYLDINDTKSIEQFINFVLEDTNHIDVLINNAGYGSFGALEDVSIEEARNQFNTNVFGLMEITQKVLPIMRKQNNGRIINISSIGGKMYTILGGWYYATKHSVEVLSDVLRNEVKDFNIKVIIIEPGGTKTNWQSTMAQHMLDSTPNDSPYYDIAHKYTSFMDDMPLKIAEANDIAKLCLKAIKAKKPKLRYLNSFSDKAMVFAYTKLPTKLIDAILNKMMKRFK
jgi:short-subunit dehydrogenase